MYQILEKGEVIGEFDSNNAMLAHFICQIHNDTPIHYTRLWSYRVTTNRTYKGNILTAITTTITAEGN